MMDYLAFVRLMDRIATRLAAEEELTATDKEIPAMAAEGAYPISKRGIQSGFAFAYYAGRGKVAFTHGLVEGTVAVRSPFRSGGS